MKKLWVALSIFAMLAAIGAAPQAPGAGPYKVIKTAKVGGAGGFDYVYADTVGRRLYIPRTGAAPRVTVFDLDTLAPVGEIPKANARGAAVDPVSGHGFCSSKPVVMWDTKTLAPLKSIDVQGNPDGIMFDPFNGRVWVFSHSAPNATVIDAKEGAVVGTVDLGGAPEQAVTDGRGRIYVAIEDKDNVAVVDAKALSVVAHYSLAGKGGGPAGLAFDAKNGILFAACHQPATMVVLSAADGKILDALPIGTGVDGAVFNPATMEAFSSQGDGTLTVVKENSPTSFAVLQTVPTQRSAKTLTLDAKTDHILLIAAEYAPPPAQPQQAQQQGQPPAKSPAGQRGGRGPMVPDSFAILVVGK